MRLFNKVAIVGVGLIGGSIGLAIKKRKLAGEVLGISRRSKTIKAGLKRGAIDRGFFDLSIASEADLVVLAAPVNSIINTGRKLSAVIKPGALVVDTGSSKKEIVAALAKILPGFVGAHPLAGSEKQGVINAHADLFKGSLCILTPTDKTRKHALTKIRRFWVQLGASVICLSPSRHDKLVSCISHLPHLVAFSLIHSIPRRNLFLAASGFRDTTRIALSDAG
ncbi:MAG: prephenate dehydrogenase/arogenate dehydrogenase family protein, partial [Candidatus Omnitrophica bacterium]|nr:prephenate dehydrogenase/arogenate dehydrogenase family protein [Candidatus Omnitrophota bacterium]